MKFNRNVGSSKYMCKVFNYVLKDCFSLFLNYKHYEVRLKKIVLILKLFKKLSNALSEV